MVRSTIITAEDFKYLTIEDFLRVYKMFRYQSNKDKILLWQTANWSFIFFNMVPAKKNIGLAKNVIPKFLEGWNGRFTAASINISIAFNIHYFIVFLHSFLPVKYSRGGGMSHPTTSRMYILHFEGKLPIKDKLLRKFLVHKLTLIIFI